MGLGSGLGDGVDGGGTDQQFGGVHAHRLEISRETGAVTECEAELGAFVAHGKRKGRGENFRF